LYQEKIRKRENIFIRKYIYTITEYILLYLYIFPDKYIYQEIYLYHNRKMLKKQILKGQVRETQTGEQEYWKGDPTSLSFSR
jgi:hypothetical protein